MTEPTIVLPGTIFTAPPSLQKLGPGLLPLTTTTSSTTTTTSTSQPEILTTKAGLLIHAPYKAHLDTSQTRYTPSQNDLCIAQIIGRHSEGYRVDLGSSLPGQLDALAFFNVNRKNKPVLNVGDLVYCRVSSYQVACMEPEVSCITADNKAGGLGPLTVPSPGSSGDDGMVGMLFKDLSGGLVRKLLDPSDVTLHLLGEKIEYEVVVGMNGRVWVMSRDYERVMVVGDVIKESERMREGEVRELIARKIKKLEIET